MAKSSLPKKPTRAPKAYKVRLNQAAVDQLSDLLNTIEESDISEITDTDLDAILNPPELIPPEEVLARAAEKELFFKQLEDLDLGIQPTDTTTKDNIMAGKLDGWMTEPDGTRKHYVDGKLHGAGDMPAEVRTNGTQLWYKNGKLHRDDGKPAMVTLNGAFKYAVDGKYHRLGGQPAIVLAVGDYRQQWWENGEIKRAVLKNGNQEWYAAGCTDKKETVLHRTDGPAIIVNDKYAPREEYYLSGKKFSNRAAWEQALHALDVAKVAYGSENKTGTVSSKTNNSQKEPKKMSTNEKPGFADVMKSNAKDAAYRVGASQSTKLVKNAILAVMKKNGSDDGALASLSTFLDTEFGSALVSMMLGTGLHYVPHFGEDPRIQRLGEELRINGMATAGNAIMDEAVGHILPALTDVLNKLPSLEQETTSTKAVRVEDKNLKDTLEEEESETEVTTAKTMRA